MWPGRPFRFAGTNNYYPMYKSDFMVDDVLQRAADADLEVFRMWAFLDIGNADFSNSVHTNPEGVYFHYWDPATGEPAFNDGESGLTRMDRIIAKAAELDLKLVLPLTNNWSDFGGIDQYVRWRETEWDPASEGERMFHHSDFYTDPVIRGWYRDWIEHVLNRVNTITGVAYKDDPTIMLWELGNEPRCIGSGVYPGSPECDTDTLITWADELSTFIKSIDGNHLVSVGDEGFFCDPTLDETAHWTERCTDGVDSVGLASVANIDVLSYHLYPDHWGTDAGWGTDWIERHIAAGRRIGKPAILGEFGWADESTRNPVYKDWTDAVIRSQGAGALYWILSGLEDNGQLYPDYDGYTVYCPSAVCTTITNFGQILDGRPASRLAPVADNDTVVTEYLTPVSFRPTANDIAYGRHNRIDVGSLDLDPSTHRCDHSLETAAGRFDYARGVLTFTPADGFAGDVSADYVVKDQRRRPANVATIDITVKPLPGEPITIADFEDGDVSAWRDINSGDLPFTVVDDPATGSTAIEIVGAGTWYGFDLPAPLDLSDGYSRLTWDLTVVSGGGTNRALSLPHGADYTWCQSDFLWVPQAETPTTVEVDLLGPGCNNADIRQIWLWVQAGSTVRIDNVIAG
jgi:mannan endo-1,4-beta-mannosidase